MSLLKRKQRAKAKERARGTHARPGGPVYPLMRVSAAGLLMNPSAPHNEVPAELQSRDFDFPRVPLPDARPQVSAAELRDALADDDTQPIEPFWPGEKGPELVEPIKLPEYPVFAGKVVDEAPQPAQHEGLAPAAVPVIPVPSLPFLNAGAPQPRTEVIVRVGNALPARLTDVELAMLGRAVPLDAPQAPSLPAPLRRDARHPFRFDAFDSEFWELVNDTARQYQGGPGGLRMSTDAAMDALDAHLAAIDAVHREQVQRTTGMEYAAWLASLVAEAGRPALPHRVPGAALSAIEGRELVAS